jgi:elongation factor Ts
MVDGRINKYYEQNCLLNQPFVKDQNLTVEKYLAQMSGELGGKISILQFIRMEKGEGSQKKEENFAEEIAKMVK